MSQVAKVFESKWQGFNLLRGAILAVVLGLLIIVGVLPQDRRYFLSASFAAEGRRILFTLAGVGIAVIVMFLADRLQRRAAKAAPPAPAHQGQAA